ncbi:MAG: sugar porter family MFS transporter [Candidatus Didemnitutus sp.]|nr:sugar porter family MFS transporter [Candidatus Didemnitutus sp.]
MTPRLYTALLLFIAGMGGFLYGYDIGIIGAALLYLNKTIALTAAQESAVVAAVLAGGTVSSLVAGALADVLGRKRLMLAAAVIFLASVALIVAAHGFVALFAGRTLQGLSAGMIAVVIPLYLAECLPPAIRGRGTAAFQLLLTTGILISLAVGAHYTRQVEAAHAAGAELVHVQDAAWRAMFSSAFYPAVLFLVGALLLAESPRWLLQKGKTEAARAALLRGRTPEAAVAEFAAMQAAAAPATPEAIAASGSLWQRRYIVPFVLTCAVLGLTQTTGINSILQFIVVMLQKAGLSAADAATRGTWVTAVNVVFTVVGLVLVDKLGRKVLLKIGTAGIALALIAAGATFWRIEHGMTANADSASVVSAGLMLFIASFAIGPGVCVWLALSELMPTRIRSLGMGIGLLINQGISTAIAALFLPVTTHYGYGAMFAFWAACTVAYFAVVARWLPETKGRTLEEIEEMFARR